MVAPPPPYSAHDPLRNRPSTSRIEVYLTPNLERRDDPSRPRRNAIDLGRRGSPSHPRRSAFELARDDPFNPLSRSAVPGAVRNAIDAATPDPFNPRRRDPASPAQSTLRGVPQRAPITPAQRTVDSRGLRNTVRGPASPAPTNSQWNMVASAKPVSALSPVYLFSARDTSKPSTWHFGYGSSPTAPEHVLSCPGPPFGRGLHSISLDPLQYRYDHIQECYDAHSRVEKLLRAYLKHREDCDCGCSLAEYTGLGLTGRETRCEKIWGPGFRVFFRALKVGSLIDKHDEYCSCGCLGKRRVQYVEGQRLDQVEPPAWCIYGFMP